jgi:hypothetical protein
MSTHVKASDYKEWEKYGLEDYGDFSDCTSDCNIRTYGDDSTTGTWFYIPDEPLKNINPDVIEEELQGDHGPVVPHFRVIYHGSWGNDNSPGASHYTYAEIYDMNDEEDVVAYEKFSEELESAEEFLPDEYQTDKCEGELWECETCNEEFCQFHGHVTDKGTNVECVSCERERKESVVTE